MVINVILVMCGVLVNVEYLFCVLMDIEFIIWFVFFFGLFFMVLGVVLVLQFDDFIFLRLVKYSIGIIV